MIIKQALQEYLAIHDISESDFASYLRKQANDEPSALAPANLLKMWLLSGALGVGVGGLAGLAGNGIMDHIHGQNKKMEPRKEELATLNNSLAELKNRNKLFGYASTQ